MDGSHFDTLTQSLHRRYSRRGLAGVLSGLALGGPLPVLGQTQAEAKRKKKKKKKKHVTTPTAPPPPPPPPPPPAVEPAYTCQPFGETNVRTVRDNWRLAQTFVASRSGSLRQIDFPIHKESSTSGDWVVQLLRVTGGTPGSTLGDILATVTILDASVPPGESILTATFTGPQLVQGTEYAASITRQSGAWLDVRNNALNGEICTGETFVATSSGPFEPNKVNYGGSTKIDLIVSVLVF